MQTAKELYDKHALGTWEQFVPVLMNGLREHIDRLAEICKTVHSLRPRSVLDAPCATGLISALISLYLDGPEIVHGIDISEEYVRIARHVFGVDAVCRDILQYDSAIKYDLVMCMELLEHVPNPQDYVKKILSLSSRHVLFSVPVEAQPVDGEIHVRKVHPTELVDWIEAAGSKISRIWLLPSAFGEKPKWLGWLFAIAEV